VLSSESFKRSQGWDFQTYYHFNIARSAHSEMKFEVLLILLGENNSGRPCGLSMEGKKRFLKSVVFEAPKYFWHHFLHLVIRLACFF
jgi:hypothetical protein